MTELQRYPASDLYFLAGTAIQLLPEDMNRLEKAYAQSPLENMDSDRFFSKVLGTLFAEVMESKRRNGYVGATNLLMQLQNKESAYAGFCLRKHIDEETHYALERQGHRWDDHYFRGLTSEQYQQMRYNVIDAFITRAKSAIQSQGVQSLPVLGSLESFLQ